jgi:hypothetical protein
MDGLKISSGVKRIAINDDQSRVIEFNPSDVGFAERFYALYKELLSKEGDIIQKSKAFDDQMTNVDENGVPVAVEEMLAFQRETCEYMHAKIDGLFGAGTSLKVFEGAHNFEMIGEFFEGITQFFEGARREKIAKYAKQSKRAMR